MRKLSDEERLGSTLGIRLTADENARLEALVQRIPIASKHGIARVALRLGLAELESDPARFLVDAKPARPKAKRRKVKP